ncbi:MAG: hypothetical protein A2901_00050 [Elusimicrobia bacterium RIFCSPLOWO2_01_FULL_54_10]|nr:MAG: hypothetical protein A2901_00050 [Elusimicrobia bacterium RIFCSPLOWO2_01_FULL_54_10]
MNKIRIVLAAALLAPGTALAGSSASFLRLGTDAKALGMGSAYTAVAQDSNALYWNPAGMARLRKADLSATYAALYSDLKYNTLSFARPTRMGSFGVSAFHLDAGEQEGRTESRARSSDFSVSDLAVTLGYARRAAGALNLGISAKWIESRIADESARSFAFDAGAQTIVPGTQVQAGFAVLNLGPKMKFLEESETLPLTLSGGVAYGGLKFLLLSADVRQDVYNSRTLFSMGAEFSPLSWVSLRAGFLSHGVSAFHASNKFETGKFSGLSGLGLGLGMKLGRGRVDYSINPAGELGSAQRITLSLTF